MARIGSKPPKMPTTNPTKPSTTPKKPSTGTPAKPASSWAPGTGVRKPVE